MAEHQYVILSKPNCQWCEKAKQLLTANNLPYTEFDLTKHTVFRDFLIAGDKPTVPQIFYRGYWIGGYSDLEEAFAYADN